MSRKRAASSSNTPQPCSCCFKATPVDQPGWVILLDRRLVCDGCYRTGKHLRGTRCGFEQQSAAFSQQLGLLP